MTFLCGISYYDCGLSYNGGDNHNYSMWLLISSRSSSHDCSVTSQIMLKAVPMTVLCGFSIMVEAFLMAVVCGFSNHVTAVPMSVFVFCFVLFFVFLIMVDVVPMTVLCDFTYHGDESFHNYFMRLVMSGWRQFLFQFFVVFHIILEAVRMTVSCHF